MHYTSIVLIAAGAAQALSFDMKLALPVAALALPAFGNPVPVTSVNKARDFPDFPSFPDFPNIDTGAFAGGVTCDCSADKPTDSQDDGNGNTCSCSFTKREEETPKKRQFNFHDFFSGGFAGGIGCECSADKPQDSQNDGKGNTCSCSVSKREE